MKGMKALILLAEGFETVEALATYDVFKRSHQIEPTLCSIADSLSVLSSQGILVKADVLLQGLDLSAYDMLILPGGKKGVENLSASQAVEEAILYFWNARDKEVHAICAAPSILRKMGLLDKRTYTCFPGFEGEEGHYTGKGVEVDDDLITGKSMGYTVEFALAIVNRHFGDETVHSIEKGVYGKKA